MSNHFNFGIDLEKVKALSKSALKKAKTLGCTYADFRYEYERSESISVRDTFVESVNNSQTNGYGIRVLYDQTWGFASGSDSSQKGVEEIVAKAVTMAKNLAKINKFPVVLSNEPAVQGKYVSDYKINPFDVDLSEKISYILAVTKKLKEGEGVDYADFGVNFVEENKYFASSEGSETIQKRIRTDPGYTITSIDKEKGTYETLSSITYPVGMGYEAMEFFDFLSLAEKSPKLLQEKMHAESIKPGKYDLVIDPTNLWLVIHESIGHATELDRVLGYEANYAGTSFATLDNLNTLHYTSPIISVKADRIQKNGLGTVGFDDEGVKGQEWYLINKGILVDYQYTREIAKRHNFEHSNGCAYADSWASFPIQRMPNVSIEPASGKVTTNDLIKKVKNGIYIVGDNSWSIDMQRYNFQFTGQLFYKIEDGKITGMYKDVAYQSNTVAFWNACEEVGDKSTYILSGSFNCGKGQPGQVAPVSHGAPSALFRNINVLNTQDEN